MHCVTLYHMKWGSWIRDVWKLITLLVKYSIHILEMFMRFRCNGTNQNIIRYISIMYFNRVYTIPVGKYRKRGFKICCSGMLGHNFMHCQKFVSKWWYLWYTHATRHLWWLGQQWLLVPNHGQLPFYQCMLGRNSWSIHITRYLKQNYSHHWSILPVTSWRDHPRRVRRPSCMHEC